MTMRFRSFIVLGVFVLAACGGGGASSEGPMATATSAPVGGGSSSAGTLVSTSFAIGSSTAPDATKQSRSPQYLGIGAVSVSITLNTVNGGAPPNGLTRTVNSSITPGSCPCNVSGPLVPPGSDNFTFSTYDGANATGNEIATFTGTYTITAGAANTGNSVTLRGIPASFSLSLPSGTAGTAFGTPAAVTLTVKDVDGHPITGTYANAVTVSDSDTTGAQGTQLAINGGSAASSVSSTSASDALTLNYGGLAIAPATVTASASGATSGTATFTPTLSPIVYSGPVAGSTPELDLYATSGTGSSATFSASETGFTNAPYSKSLSASAPGCTSIGTISANANSFTFTAVSAPSAGTCTITVSDGLGQTKAVTGTYTTSGFGVL